MRRLTSRIERGGEAPDRLILPFHDRRRTRVRARLESGEEVAIVLARGTVLRAGDVLADDSGGAAALVCAADERVSTVWAAGAAQARAAYHLGNRHVAVEVGDGWLRYLHDHVLDEMVRQLGLELTVESAPFEPEAGAYGADQHHAHAH